MAIRLTMALMGSVLLGTTLTDRNATADDPFDDARRISRNIGMAVGAASACEDLAQNRIKMIAARLADEIAGLTNAREQVIALHDSYDQGITAGQNAVNAKQKKCPTALADLAYWEDHTTAWFTPPAATPALPKPGITKANATSDAPPVTLTAMPVILAQATSPAPPPAAPVATPAPAPQAAAVRGVTDREIRLGMSAPLSGPARELGRQMKLGIETAFNIANEAGGVNGRKVVLVAADDGYEPNRTGETMKQLYEKDQVFGIVGNVGTPTAAVALPFALSRKMMFFGAFTGASLLRRDPPDRYVFNYRASYAEETSAVVHYLVKVKRIRPEQIAVFAQQDGFGDAGFEGVTKAMRTLRGPTDTGTVPRFNYQRNTVDVDDAINQLNQYQRQRPNAPIKAVVMVATYRAAAKFIEKTKDQVPGLVYTNVSFVGSTALADELMVLGPKYANGVIVTQVVPAVEGYASVVLDYKAALAKQFPGEAADYVSFEGYLAGSLLIEGLRRAGPQLDTERLVTALEGLRDVDLGLGTSLNFSRADHQSLHKVWGTQLDATGHYQPIDLE